MDFKFRMISFASFCSWPNFFSRLLRRDNLFRNYDEKKLRMRFASEFVGCTPFRRERVEKRGEEDIHFETHART